MTANGWWQIGFFLLMILFITKPLGVFMARVFSGGKTFLDPVLWPVEKLVYRLTGVDEKHEMRWTEYAIAMLLFSGVSMTLLYLIERMQRWLPLNPQKFSNLEPGLAFGTAASFTTNTNWQAYSAHDFFGSQRCGQVFCEYPGDVCGGVSGSWRSERDAPAHSRVGDSFGGYFQRADHRCAHPASAAWGALSPAGSGGAATAEFAHLRPGRNCRAIF
jgi:Potassium-transporting ATPase A subunit